MKDFHIVLHILKPITSEDNSVGRGISPQLDEVNNVAHTQGRVAGEQNTGCVEVCCQPGCE